MTVVVRRGPLVGRFLIAGCGKEGPACGRIPYHVQKFWPSSSVG